MTTSPPRKLIAGNWKLHLKPTDAAALALALHRSLGDCQDVDIAIFPSMLALDRVATSLDQSAIAHGVQWASQPGEGAFTGQTCLQHVRDLGCSWSLIGHSETRAMLGVQDDDVNAAVHNSLKAGLCPMICVGDSLAQHTTGQAVSVVISQVEQALHGLAPDQVASCVIAYEPLWAIGTGHAASVADAQHILANIRQWLQRQYPPFVYEQTRLLYGGSVKPANAAALLGAPDIHGVLVGGASLNASSFCAIVEAAMAVSI